MRGVPPTIAFRMTQVLTKLTVSSSQTVNRRQWQRLNSGSALPPPSSSHSPTNCTTSSVFPCRICQQHRRDHRGQHDVHKPRVLLPSLPDIEGIQGVAPSGLDRSGPTSRKDADIAASMFSYCHCRMAGLARRTSTPNALAAPGPPGQHAAGGEPGNRMFGPALGPDLFVPIGPADSKHGRGQVHPRSAIAASLAKYMS